MQAEDILKPNQMSHDMHCSCLNPKLHLRCNLVAPVNICLVPLLHAHLFAPPHSACFLDSTDLCVSELVPVQVAVAAEGSLV